MSEEKPRSLGQWIIEHRKRANLTQAEACLAAGYSLPQWRRFEHDQSIPPRDAIARIAEVIKADPAETFRQAGFLPPPALQPDDERELLRYYQELPPICRTDMLSLAKQLHTNHVRLAGRAARLSSAARAARESSALPSAPDESWVLVATPAGPMLAPANWSEIPSVREVVLRLRALGVTDADYSEHASRTA